MLQTYAGELQMTRVDIFQELTINSALWLIHTHTYIYEKGFKSDHLDYTFRKLKRAKFKFYKLYYNKELDVYNVWFRLDVII